MAGNLSLNKLSVGYGSKVIIQDVSVQIEPGQLVCLLGLNGAGKSTLLRTIANLQRPLAGSITLDGRDMAETSKSEIARQVGIVLTERPDTGSMMTVRELVSIGRSPYTGFLGKLSAEDEDIIDEAIAQMGIASLATRDISTLSDGELQKAMIAKTLAQKTTVMLLDEPSAFLDYPSKVELFNTLSSLAKKEQKAILISTHDVELALRLCDKSWLVSRGKLTVAPPTLSPYDFMSLM